MILIIDMNWKKDSLGYYEFVLPIISIVEKLNDCQTKHYSEVTAEDLNSCSHIILSGTTLKDNFTLTQPEKFTWITETKKPVLGICAGMQIIGAVYGSTISRCPEVGMVQMMTTKDNPLFSATFKAYSLHNYSVEPSKEFDIIAKSDQCIQALKHKEKPIFGVLFHPEARNEEIIRHFVQFQ
jgi:anthranilate/para-aminobenzoate synthase component II